MIYRSSNLKFYLFWTSPQPNTHTSSHTYCTLTQPHTQYTHFSIQVPLSQSCRRHVLSITSGYHISPTVSSNIFSFWLLLTVGDQTGPLGPFSNGPRALWTMDQDQGWSGPLGPLIWTWVHCAAQYVTHSLGLTRGVRGPLWMFLVH